LKLDIETARVVRQDRVSATARLLELAQERVAAAARGEVNSSNEFCLFLVIIVEDFDRF